MSSERAAIAEASIKKFEKAVMEWDDAKEKYYNAFWKTKSELHRLDKESQFYEVQPQEVEDKLKNQFDEKIKDIDNKLREFKPDEKILEHKRTIVSLRGFLNVSKNSAFFPRSRCVINEETVCPPAPAATRRLE